MYGAAYARPIINPSNGNIRLQGRGGATIVFSMQDSSGAFIDLTDSILSFELAGYYEIALVAGAASTQQLIVLTDAQVSALPLNAAIPFAVRDATGTPIQVVWSGHLTTYGFNAAP